MTFRTTSATRRRVVSRSSDVANPSATSSSKDSAGKRSGLETTEPIARMIAAAFPGAGSRQGNADKKACDEAVRPNLFSGNHANVGQIAILFGVIQPIADDKFIRNLEADVITFQRELAPRGLVE